MGLIITDSQNYTDIATAIRAGNGTNTTYRPSEMADAIVELSGNWLGKNPEFVKQIYSLDTTLDTTNYATWTPSTTATTIKAAQTLTTKETLDMSKYDYIFYWICICDIAYNNSWIPAKGSALKQATVYTQGVFQRPTGVTETENEVYDLTASQQDSQSLSWLKYYSSATNISVINGTYSPCYISGVTAPTFNSTSSLEPIMTIKTPVLTARCHATYFTTAVAAQVDQENTTIKMKGYLYRVKRGTSVCSSIWKLLIGAYNDSNF